MVEERAQCLCGTGGKNNNKKKRDEIVARDGRDVFPGVIVWLTAHSTAPAAALGAPQAAGPPPQPTSSLCRCLQTNGTRGCPNCRRLSVKPGYV